MYICSYYTYQLFTSADFEASADRLLNISFFIFACHIRVISCEEGKALAESWNAAFMESSAKENQVEYLLICLLINFLYFCGIFWKAFVIVPLFIRNIVLLRLGRCWTTVFHHFQASFAVLWLKVWECFCCVRFLLCTWFLDEKSPFH